MDCGDCRRDGMCVGYCAMELAAQPGWVPEPTRLTLRRPPKKPDREPGWWEPFEPASIPHMILDHIRAELEARTAGRKFRECGIDIEWEDPKPVDIVPSCAVSQVSRWDK